LGELSNGDFQQNVSHPKSSRRTVDGDDIRSGSDYAGKIREKIILLKPVFSLMRKYRFDGFCCWYWLYSFGKKSPATTIQRNWTLAHICNTCELNKSKQEDSAWSTTENTKANVNNEGYLLHFHLPLPVMPVASAPAKNISTLEFVVLTQFFLCHAIPCLWITPFRPRYLTISKTTAYNLNTSIIKRLTIWRATCLQNRRQIGEVGEAVTTRDYRNVTGFIAFGKETSDHWATRCRTIPSRRKTEPVAWEISSEYK